MNWQTHQVTNQVPPLTGYNLYATDPALCAALARHGGGWHAEALERDGARLAQVEMLAMADLANRYTPALFAYDPRGERIDALEFHPSWHVLLGALRREGLHAMPFSQPRPGAMAARCAGYFLHGQIEAGTLCPVTMTFASIPVLANEPALFATLRDKLFTLEHDARDMPLPLKQSMLVGMGMTEKQGGSDVRSNRTYAIALGTGGRGTAYRLVGHKWFFSAPQSDAHLVLARAGGDGSKRSGDNHDDPLRDGPLSCFYVPRFTPDGRKNAVHIQRLKDKLGNRSNASSEVEFADAYGVMLGEEGRGVPTIIEMASYTRLDCVVGSAALMRASLVQAIHHARHRRAFGRLLVDQPLMRNVLADLAIEAQAATVLFMQLAHAFETVDAHAQARPAAPGAPVDNARALAARAWRRIVTPAAKFWVCKRALAFTGEAMEVWGGNGYVETGPMCRFYREAPVNSIWEGSGNVMCLDVLRAIGREPEAAAALFADLYDAARADARVCQALDALAAELREPAEAQEVRARHIARQLVLICQASLLMSAGPANLAEAFIASRLDPAQQSGRGFGTLSAQLDHASLIAGAFPHE